MTAPIRPATRIGRFYEVSIVDDTVRLEPVAAALPELVVHAGELVGMEVRVSSRALAVEDGDDGLVGRRLDPITGREARLCFDTAGGGARTRENRLSRGAHNAVVAEATGFGMVNAFVHATRIARYLNRLLGQLGAAPLPALPVVVGAHPGSRLPGFGHADGDFRSGRMRPLFGGHYRLSQRTSGVPEPFPVAPTGEVHLGPGRVRQRFAGRDGYLRCAAHNPVTVYHEVGHHLCRHTADFRLNAERYPDEQRNGKIGVDEGVCDYLAASFLGTGRPYGWYSPERGAHRDPGAWRELAALIEDLPPEARVYATGARWAALWWRCRGWLIDEGRVRSAVDHDRVVIATLLAIGEVGRGTGSRRRRQSARCAPATVLDTYVDCMRQVAGPGGAARVLDFAESYGLPAC